MRGGFSFVVSLFLYLSLEQGEKTRRDEGLGQGGRKGEASRWFKKGCSVTVGEPSGDSAGHVGG